MKNLRIVIFLIFLSFLATFSVLGLSCRKAQTAKTVLKVWLVDYKETNFRSEIQLFSQKQKVDITVEEKNAANLEKDLLNTLATHQGPDVVMINHDFLIKHKEIFAPCVKEVKKDKALYCDVKILENNYVPVTQILAWDDKIYGYPYRVSTPIIIYNSKMLYDARKELQKNNLSYNHIPVYWDDFVKMARILTVKDASGNVTRSGLALGTASNNPAAQDTLYSLMLQNGTKISNAQSAEPLALFNLPIKNENGDLIYPGAKALDFYSSFSYPRSQNYSFNDNFDTAWKELAKGNVAMIIDYPERLDKIRYLNPNLQVAGALLPQITDTENPTVYGKIYALGITRDTKDVVMAWKLAGQIAQKFDSKYVKKQTTSSSKDWRKAKGAAEAWTVQVNFAQTIYKAKFPDEFDQFVKEAIDNVSKGLIYPKESLDQAASNINQLISESK